MKTLVLRFSSLGDVILTIPVFKTLAVKLPNHKFYLVTRPAFKELFDNVSNVEVIPVDVDEQFKGPLGLHQLAKFLLQFDFGTVVDLHDVLRTKVIRKVLRTNGKDVIVFNKGRNEKKTIINGKQDLKYLRHTSDRYLKAFEFLKDDLTLVHGPWLLPKVTNNDFSFIPNEVISQRKEQKWIGIAPFSKHESKEWTDENWHSLVQQFSLSKYQVFLFAFGQAELKRATNLKESNSSIIIIDSDCTLQNQIHLLKNLDVLISCDSANMHLASILGTKVISLWFSTHPCIGFSPLENENGIILPKVKDQLFKPLSIYGKIKSKNDLKLVLHYKKQITIDLILGKVQQLTND